MLLLTRPLGTHEQCPERCNTSRTIQTLGHVCDHWQYTATDAGVWTCDCAAFAIRCCALACANNVISHSTECSKQALTLVQLTGTPAVASSTHLDPDLKEQYGNQCSKQLPAEPREPVDPHTCIADCQQQAHDCCPQAHPATPGQVQLPPQARRADTERVHEAVDEHDGLGNTNDQQRLTTNEGLQAQQRNSIGQGCKLGRRWLWTAAQLVRMPADLSGSLLLCWVACCSTASYMSVCCCCVKMCCVTSSVALELGIELWSRHHQLYAPMVLLLLCVSLTCTSPAIAVDMSTCTTVKTPSAMTCRKSSHWRVSSCRCSRFRSLRVRLLGINRQ